VLRVWKVQVANCNLCAVYFTSLHRFASGLPRPSTTHLLHRSWTSCCQWTPQLPPLQQGTLWAVAVEGYSYCYFRALQPLPP
jgi:hypothetical protein